MGKYKQEYEDYSKDNIKSLGNLRIYRGNSFNALCKNYEYEALSIYNLYQANINEARNNLYKALFVERLQNELALKKYPNLEFKKRLEIVCHENWHGYKYGLCCKDEAFFQKYLKNTIVFGNEHKANYNFTASLIKKGMLTQNQALIDEHLPRFRQIKAANLRGFEKGDYMCIEGILNHDVNRFNEGSQFIIKAYKREAGVTIEANVCIWATAMVILAQRMGLDPDLSDSFISKELVNAEDKSFDLDDDLKSYVEQLEILNANGGQYPEENVESNEEPKGFWKRLFR